MYTNRYPHIVHEYFVARVREIMDRRRDRIAALRTRRDAEAYVRHVRRAVRRCFPGMPKRTPLNPVVTGRDEYPDYFVEKVLFETRPGFLATGNLYLPKGFAGKRAGVLGICGHDDAGKAGKLYQGFSAGLARRGLVVFVYDPIDQGERAQYYPSDGGPPLGKDGLAIPSGCPGHNRTGNQLVLLDDFFGTWRAWDGIRALDYLCSRKEVDRTRLGVTGNSGGGTLSGYMTALDPRLTMAAPSCFVCSYQVNLEWELPCDSEQNPPGIIGAGLDHGDLLMCYAPRPTLIMGQHQDFFSSDWAERTALEVRKVYKLLGAEKNVECFIGPRAHGYHVENREAMYKFFLKHAGLRGSPRERAFSPVPDRKLFAAPRGETYRAGSRRVFEITAERAVAAAVKRGKPSKKAVIDTARKLMNIPDVSGPPYWRSIRHAHRWEPLPHQHLQFAVETEPGILTILTTFGPFQGPVRLPTGNVTLYVGHTSGQDDVAKVPEVRKLTRGRDTLVVADPRGIGQSRVLSAGSREFFDGYGSDFMYAANADMLGESYLGRRVFDILRVIDLLHAEGAAQVRLLGRGLGAVTVAFAALLHPSNPRARILNYLPSYELVARTAMASWPFSSLLRGVLNHFDLPDVYRALGRRLTRSKPWDARMRPLGKRSRT